eukprot:CCRYP_020867-RA/>CCRYP_020867-RA protein AED:0.36 eAED:0.38 QI:0/0/0/1/0/0/2/0/123
MMEREHLHGRVEFLGYVPHSSVRDVLVRGNVFLNCSLAESFCVAILEAASAGLFVVSTNVRGVSEVLPPEMIHHADPNVCLLGITLHFVVFLVELWQPLYLIDGGPDLCIDKDKKHSNDNENS